MFASSLGFSWFNTCVGIWIADNSKTDDLTEDEVKSIDAAASKFEPASPSTDKGSVITKNFNSNLVMVLGLLFASVLVSAVVYLF